MSDLTPEETDELASAYLDGEATAEERAMVETDPDLLARAEQFRQATAEVASPVAEAGREKIIARALKSFKPAEAKSWKVPKLRIASRDRSRNLVPIFSVAAVLVVVFLAISVIVLLGDDAGDDSDAVESLTTSAATQASESDQFLESDGFSPALDERQSEMSTAPAAAPATTASVAAAAITAAPATTAAAPLIAPDDAVSADDAAEAAFAPVTTSAAQLASPADANAAPAAEGRTSDLPEETVEGFNDLNADGPPPLEFSADLGDADAGPSTGECPTEEDLEAPSEDDDSEGEFEEEEEPAPDPSPPPVDSSAVSSDTVPSDHEDALSDDAPLVECP